VCVCVLAENPLQQSDSERDTFGIFAILYYTLAGGNGISPSTSSLSRGALLLL